MRKRVIVFDVNETLLDPRVLAPQFERMFAEPQALHQWSRQVVHSALLSVAAGPYCEFGRVARSALDMLAALRGVKLAESDYQAVISGVRTLPPHPEVPAALRRLNEAGFRLATLTNWPLAIAEAQVTNAGIAPYFERILSADTVRRLKPAAEVYRYAADSFGVAPADIRLVAAHAWDVVGAMRAGCRTALIARPGVVLDPLFEAPEVIAPGLGEVAAHIIAVDHDGRTDARTVGRVRV